MISRTKAYPLAMSRAQSGFTLIEMLVAIALFALLVAICYTALGPAANGFRELARARNDLGRTEMIARQLRMDTAYAMASQDKNVLPFSMQVDRRGNASFDRFTLTTHEVGQPVLVEVHYFIDESTGVLERDSILPWARNGVKPMRWDLGPVTSFQVEAMDAAGNWLQNWSGGLLPKAIRITLRDARSERQWVLPIDTENAATLQQELGQAGAGQ